MLLFYFERDDGKAVGIDSISRADMTDEWTCTTKAERKIDLTDNTVPLAVADPGIPERNGTESVLGGVSFVTPGH